MTKEELIKKLEELRDVKNYSHYELTNKGYREGLLDALDLVNKYFDLALVSGRSEQCLHTERVWTIDPYDQKCFKCVNCGVCSF
jgi:hypothetical protein